MKLVTGCLFAALLCAMAYTVTAQGKHASISGKIVLENIAAADGVNVTLLKSNDSSVIKSGVTDKKGFFKFTDLSAGNYKLRVSKVGYLKITSGPYALIAGQDMMLPDIWLKLAVNEIKEVGVVGQRDYVEVKGDKTVLNVSQNIGAAGNSIFDVLKNAPGVKVSGDQILYKAGQKALIAINGKPVVMTDEQLANLLKSYQSSMISQIELIQNPSAKYDASSAGGVINIILKKNKNLGTNASVSQSAAYGEQYKFTTNLNLNIRTKKLNIFSSYSFADNKLDRTFDNNRYITNGTESDNFNLNYKSITKAVTNSFNAGADYSLTSNQTIGILLSGYHNDNNIDKLSTTNISTNGLADSVIHTGSHINRDLSTLNYNLNYQGRFGKDGRSTISANVDYADYNRKSLEYLHNVTSDPAGRQIGDTIFYKDQSPSNIRIWSERLDFSQVLTKNSSFDAGIKNNQINSDNQIDFDQLINSVYQPIPSLTDHFVYQEKVFAGYLTYNLKADGITYRFGLRGEETHSDALSINPNRTTNQQYFNLFPNVALTKNINKDNLLRFFYARSIIRPNYQDLNPFVGYVDQFYYSTGNPFLKPQYINRVELSDFIAHRYRVTIGVTVTNNFSTTIFQQNDTTKVYTTTRSNIATRYQYHADFELPLDLATWWKLDLSLTSSYEKYDYFNNAGTKTAYDLAINGDQGFKITNKLSAQVVTFYEIPTYFAISNYRAYYYVNAGFSYKILGDDGSIKLFADDIFKTNYYRYHTNYMNLDLTQQERVPVRFLTATFTYNFGNLLLKAARKVAPSVEQRRLEAGGEN